MSGFLEVAGREPPKGLPATKSDRGLGSPRRNRRRRPAGRPDLRPPLRPQSAVVVHPVDDLVVEVEDLAALRLVEVVAGHEQDDRMHVAGLPCLGPEVGDRRLEQDRSRFSLLIPIAVKTSS